MDWMDIPRSWCATVRWRLRAVGARAIRFHATLAIVAAALTLLLEPAGTLGVSGRLNPRNVTSWS